MDQSTTLASLPTTRARVYCMFTTRALCRHGIYHVQTSSLLRSDVQCYPSHLFDHLLNTGLKSVFRQYSSQLVMGQSIPSFRMSSAVISFIPPS